MTTHDLTPNWLTLRIDEQGRVTGERPSFSETVALQTYRDALYETAVGNRPDTHTVLMIDLNQRRVEHQWKRGEPM